MPIHDLVGLLYVEASHGCHKVSMVLGLGLLRRPVAEAGHEVVHAADLVAKVDHHALGAPVSGELFGYQDLAYAREYVTFVEKVRGAEEAAVPGPTELAEAVATYLYKLMPYKDEREVA